MKIIKKKEKIANAPEIHMEWKRTDDKLEIRHLKTDYPVSDKKIKQLDHFTFPTAVYEGSNFSTSSEKYEVSHGNESRIEGFSLLRGFRCRGLWKPVAVHIFLRNILYTFR